MRTSEELISTLNYVQSKIDDVSKKITQFPSWENWFKKIEQGSFESINQEFISLYIKLRTFLAQKETLKYSLKINK